MTQAPRLTDRPALLRNRERALRDPALFLHKTAAEELQDRLAMVNKTFRNVAIVTGFPAFWSGIWPEATLVADEDVLALEETTFDLVIHAMALHWANDPVGQIIQCRRALKPDGLFLAALFGGQTLTQLRAALAEAEIEVSGGLSPRVVPMAEIRDLGGLLQRAGLTLPVADNLNLTASYQSPLHLMRDLRAMGEVNAMADRHRHFSRPAILRRAAEIYQSIHGDSDRRIPASYELVFLTGWSPDDSQPQPLRPGSAKTRLATALGTLENPLPD